MSLAMPTERYWLYILASRHNGTIYLGMTNDLARRVHEHKTKANPGFTATYGVDRLVWFEEYQSIIEAQMAEHKMKKWRRAWKLALIEKHNPDWLELELPL
jgi:putative endonuclease